MTATRTESPAELHAVRNREWRTSAVVTAVELIAIVSWNCSISIFCFNYATYNETGGVHFAMKKSSVRHDELGACQPDANRHPEQNPGTYG
jgi:hypothetical protein